MAISTSRAMRITSDEVDLISVGIAITAVSYRTRYTCDTAFGEVPFIGHHPPAWHE